MKKETNKAHLTESDRHIIRKGIMSGESATQISKEIGCSNSTVSREIRKHLKTQKKGGFGKAFNDCSHRSHCQKRYECLNCIKPKKNTCSYCSIICCSSCDSYERVECSKLKTFPYVCDGCKEDSTCTLMRQYYNPREAQKEYSETLSESRRMLHITKDEFQVLQTALETGFKKGHSINHIFSYVDGELGIGQRTAYNYVNNGYFDSSVIRCDMPKAVKYRKRQKAKSDTPCKDQSYLKGRTYAEFKMLLEDSNASVVEMDCVEGKRGGNGKVLLTLLFRSCSLQLAFIMDRQDEEHVSAVFKELREKLGKETFNKLFSVILTDRGKEFKDPSSIENDSDGKKTLSVYYCSPSSPQEKPFCERNHSEIRKIFKKGRDIEFDSEKCQKMMNHINSYSRPQFGNKSAYEMFVYVYGQEIADALGLCKIPAQDINLTPNCLN